MRQNALFLRAADWAAINPVFIGLGTNGLDRGERMRGSNGGNDGESNAPAQ